MKIFRMVIAIGMASAVSVVQGQNANLGTATKTPVLVELFTSEGCSSCPPADALLQRIDAAQPVSGAQLIVLSEHVDYWDHEGWKDPYSSSSATERQSEYVRALGLETAYTPQFIIDGATEFRIGKDPRAWEVFQKAVAVTKVPIDIDSPTIEGNPASVLRARIDVDGTGERHNADIYVAVALDHAESQVSKGENSGRHLLHVAVVEQLSRVGKLEKGRRFEKALDLKLKPGIGSTDLRIIVFVQESGPGRVVGAAFRKIAG